MKVIEDPSAGECLAERHAVTIGVFDGIHLGHQYVIGETRRQADAVGDNLAVVTFDPHPARIVRPASAPKILTGIDHRLELLDRLGVDTTVVIMFDLEQASEGAADFVERVIVKCLMARSVTVGADFHFGHRREGNVPFLVGLGHDLGFEVNALSAVERTDSRGEAISSTAIRQALTEGDVRRAAAMLGRFHQVRGTVAAGDRRGRTIGFPTANLDVSPDLAIPADGVYAAWYLTPDGVRHRAATNIGKRPTFYADADRSLVEAHLLDFDGDLYGQLGRVEFVARLRGEQRFQGIEALQAQLRTDVEAAHSALAG